MRVLEDTQRRLVVAVRQKSFVFLGGFFALFGVAAALAGIAGGQSPFGWSIGFLVVGLSAGLLMVGIEKHVKFTFDATASELMIETRQFWKEKAQRMPLSQVTDVKLESRQQGPKTLHAIRFLGPDDTPLEFAHYIDPSPEVEGPIGLMQAWLAGFHGRTDPSL